MSISDSDFDLPGFHRIRALGTGAKSTLWEVRHATTGKSYTLKRVLVKGKQDLRFVEQAENEHNIARILNSPGVRKSYSIRKIKRYMFLREIHLLMEYCPGKSVADCLPETLPEICNIFTRVASIMHSINKAGYIHADMKPGNIIVDDSGNVMIIDLGQSCLSGTIKERIQGTPDFMAPEQINRWPLDYRTDIYNFGATIYWATTGDLPPSRIHAPGSLQTPEHYNIKKPSSLNAEIPRALDNLILGCLKPEPADRIPTMKEVAVRLGRIMFNNLKITPPGHKPVPSPRRKK